MVPSRPASPEPPDQQGVSSAIECFEQASRKSPEFAAAFSGIAVAWFYLGMFAMEAPLDAMPKAQKAATRAIAIDEHNGDAFSVLACTNAMFEWDWSGAELLFRKSLEVSTGK
jgi:hypothetical protein